MEKIQFVKDIHPGDEVHTLFLIASVSAGTARNGPFVRLELKDASGSLEATIWSPQSRDYTDIPPGCTAEVSGRCGIFRDRPQLTVDKLCLLSEEETAACDLSLFLPTSSRPPGEMLEELEKLCQRETAQSPWESFLLSVLGDAEIRGKLPAAPAAKSIHHAYAGGLLEHTLSVACLALRLADHYPELDRPLLLAAAVCHDLGKLWELTSGVRNDYSDEGRLIGHIFLGLERLDPFLRASRLAPEEVRHFKHLILSHHGEHQYGSPQLPQSAEAFSLHYADNIDAKMAQCRNLFSAFDDAAGGWSAWQPSLGRPLYRPARTREIREENSTASVPEAAEELVADPVAPEPRTAVLPEENAAPAEMQGNRGDVEPSLNVAECRRATREEQCSLLSKG